MIFISTTCESFNSGLESAQSLATAGFKQIEISYCGMVDEGYLDDLVRLKKNYNLEYICHNYFVPTDRSFVVNLASLDDNILQLSRDYIQSALKAASKLGSKYYGLHAGFLVDPQASELGGSFHSRKLADRNLALKTFCCSIDICKKSAAALGVKLFIENNVLSKHNAKVFLPSNPFLLVTADDYEELASIIDFNLLLDIGHLKVSSKSLGLSFSDQLNRLINYADHIHLSDNDGDADQHCMINKTADVWGVINRGQLSQKLVTLEMKAGHEEIKKLCSWLEEKKNDL